MSRCKAANAGCVDCINWDEDRRVCKKGIAPDKCGFLVDLPVEKEKKKCDPACVDCPYGRNHEFCFPCMKKILGRKDIPANA